MVLGYPFCGGYTIVDSSYNVKGGGGSNIEKPLYAGRWLPLAGHYSLRRFFQRGFLYIYIYHLCFLCFSSVVYAFGMVFKGLVAKCCFGMKSENCFKGVKNESTILGDPKATDCLPFMLLSQVSVAIFKQEQGRTMADAHSGFDLSRAVMAGTKAC